MTSKRKVSWRTAAEEDVARLRKEDPSVAKLALEMAVKLGTGAETGIPLEDKPRTGDLSDCFKIYFGVGQPPSHRLVYQQISKGDEVELEVVEVVAVEARDSDYVYMLASSRLKRLPKETRKAFSRIHQAVIARRSGR